MIDRSGSQVLISKGSEFQRDDATTGNVGSPSKDEVGETTSEYLPETGNHMKKACLHLS